MGETYIRMLTGASAAINDPESKYYLPDDYAFHGQGPEQDYAVDTYFGEFKYSLFGKVRSHVGMRALYIAISC